MPSQGKKLSGHPVYSGGIRTGGKENPSKNKDEYLFWQIKSIESLTSSLSHWTCAHWGKHPFALFFHFLVPGRCSISQSMYSLIFRYHESVILLSRCQKVGRFKTKPKIPPGMTEPPPSSQCPHYGENPSISCHAKNWGTNISAGSASAVPHPLSPCSSSLSFLFLLIPQISSTVCISKPYLWDVNSSLLLLLWSSWDH